jgi:hypothetical protein
MFDMDPGEELSTLDPNDGESKHEEDKSKYWVREVLLKRSPKHTNYQLMKQNFLEVCCKMDADEPRRPSAVSEFEL